MVVHISPKSGKIIITSNFSLFSLFLCLVILTITILLSLKRGLYEHFFGN